MVIFLICYVKGYEKDFSVYVSLNGKQGNIQGMSLALGFFGSWKSKSGTYRLKGDYKRQNENDKDTQDEIIVGLDYTKKSFSRTSLFARTKWEQDRIEKVSSRTILATGLSYFLAKEEELIF